METEEGLLELLVGPLLHSSREVKAILGGVVGFWGGVFGMGSIYLTMVAVKRCLNSNAEEEE